MPPARFTGPVCMAVIPIDSKASQRSWSPRVPRNEWPALVMSEIGYAVNQTGAFSIAARGSGSANGFCHMLPWPVNCFGEGLGVAQHRLLDEPLHVVGVVAGRRPAARARRCHGRIRAAAREGAAGPVARGRTARRSSAPRRARPSGRPHSHRPGPVPSRSRGAQRSGSRRRRSRPREDSPPAGVGPGCARCSALAPCCRILPARVARGPPSDHPHGRLRDGSLLRPVESPSSKPEIRAARSGRGGHGDDGNTGQAGGEEREDGATP